MNRYSILTRIDPLPVDARTRTATADLLSGQFQPEENIAVPSGATTFAAKARPLPRPRRGRRAGVGDERHVRTRRLDGRDGS